MRRKRQLQKQPVAWVVGGVGVWGGNAGGMDIVWEFRLGVCLSSFLLLLHSSHFPLPGSGKGKVCAGKGKKAKENIKKIREKV